MSSQTLNSTVNTYIGFVEKLDGFITKNPIIDEVHIGNDKSTYLKYSLNFNFRNEDNTLISKKVVFLNNSEVNFDLNSNFSVFILGYQLRKNQTRLVHDQQDGLDKILGFNSRGYGLRLKSERREIFEERDIFENNLPEAAFSIHFTRENYVEGHVSSFGGLLPELTVGRRNVNTIYEKLANRIVTPNYR